MHPTVCSAALGYSGFTLPSLGSENLRDRSWESGFPFTMQYLCPLMPYDFHHKTWPFYSLNDIMMIKQKALDRGSSSSVTFEISEISE